MVSCATVFDEVRIYISLQLILLELPIDEKHLFVLFNNNIRHFNKKESKQHTNQMCPSISMVSCVRLVLRTTGQNDVKI